MARVRLVLREKVIDEEGNIVELVIWEVPSTSENPAGLRYRLAFVRQGERARTWTGFCRILRRTSAGSEETRHG